MTQLTAVTAGARGRRGAGRQRRGTAGIAMAAAAAEEASRVAKDGDCVLVHYKVSLEDGTAIDSTTGRDPPSFTIGKRQVMQGLEQLVRGLSVGDKAIADVPPQLAFGERREDLVLDVPASKAPEGLTEGAQVQLTSGGRPITARVVKVNEDGSMTIDANHELAGKTLKLEAELVDFRELLAPSESPPGMGLATFAAGCFWGVELAFQRVPGVLSTAVGYAQGEAQAPTYEGVCSGKTGHTEAVRVVFDPNVVSFEQLLDTFWERVGRNATTLNKTGNDEGTQYRSGIYYHNEEQQRLAEKSALSLQMSLGQPVVTEVQTASPFWMAEEYHQQYLEKGGRLDNGQSAAKGCTDPIRCYG